MDAQKWSLIRCLSCFWSVFFQCSLSVIEWCRPQFSWHWGNWILAPFLAFMLGFLSTSAIAADYYYKSNDRGVVGDSYQDVCDQYSDVFTRELAGACLYAGYSVNSATLSDWTNVTKKCTFSYSYKGGSACDIDKSGSYLGYVTQYGCSEADKADPSSSCYVNHCPESGSAGAISVPLNYGSTLPEYYVVDGCKFLVSGNIDCESVTENKMENCIVQGEYTGETAEEGPTPADPGEKPQTRCYRPDGSTTELIDFDAPCPEGTTREPPDPDACDTTADPDCAGNGGDCDPNDPDCTDGGDGGDGSECDPTAEDCEANDGSDCDPEKEECPNGEGVEGGKECDPEKPPVCTGPPLTCYQIKQTWREQCGLHQALTGTDLANCSEEFTCKGSPIECFSVKLQRERACILNNKEAAVDAVEELIRSGEIHGAKLDEYGQMEGLDAGEVNISDQFNLGVIWSDSGASGSCPSPIQATFMGKSVELSFEPLCELAGYVRAMVIFMATWISASMLSQTLIGTRWR